MSELVATFEPERTNSELSVREAEEQLLLPVPSAGGSQIGDDHFVRSSPAPLSELLRRLPSASATAGAGELPGSGAESLARSLEDFLLDRRSFEAPASPEEKIEASPGLSAEPWLGLPPSAGVGPLPQVADPSAVANDVAGAGSVDNFVATGKNVLAWIRPE